MFEWPCTKIPVQAIPHHHNGYEIWETIKIPLKRHMSLGTEHANLLKQMLAGGELLPQLVTVALQ